MAAAEQARELIAPAASRIGTLQEKSLHAALKAWYAQPGDRLEVPVEGFVVDIVRGDLLIEIQTRNFSAMKRKLTRLVETHPLRLVHPIAQEKWIRRLAPDGSTEIGRRKSPKRGTLAHIFDELVSFPHLIAHPHFSLELLLIHEEEILCADDGTTHSRRRRRWRRRGWRVFDRRLIEVVERRVLQSPSDYRAFLPPGLPQPFTNQELAETLDIPAHLATRMTYCLRRMGALDAAGKRGRALLYKTHKDSHKATKTRGKS